MNNKNVTVLIVGQGIGGSSLAYFLDKQGIKTHIISSRFGASATKVSNGLCQRISGQKLGYNIHVNQFYNSAISFYKTLETELQCSLIKPMLVKKYLTNEQQSIWTKKQQKGLYLDLMDHTISSTFGSYSIVNMHDTHIVDAKHCINQLETYFLNKAMLTYDTVCQNDIFYHNQRISYKTFKADYLIFCTGFSIANHSLFLDFPFQNIKGDVFNLKGTPFKQSYCLQHSHSLIPLENGHFKFGSTYIKERTITPNKHGFSKLNHALSTLTLLPFKLLSIESGIRCALRDQKPIIGFSQQCPRIGVFSGFGSRGLIYAPGLAKKWAKHFPKLTPITDFSCNRF